MVFRFCSVVIVSLLMLSKSVSISGNDSVRTKHDNLFEYSIVAVQGVLAKLPCNIAPSIPGDKIAIVLWFKENENSSSTAIYSFDCRANLILEEGYHWSDELILGGRAHFRFQEEPAKLVINSVLSSDAGIYKCRVDFYQSPTKFSFINLTVMTPPEKLIVLDENEFEINNYILGPYNEGISIKLTCISVGGPPPPKVTWWQENALLDDSYEILSNDQVRNILYIEKLQRKHLHKVLTCQASNNDMIAPISKAVYLELNLRPLSVKILGSQKPLSAGKGYQFKCEVIGAYPTPDVSWIRGGIKMHNINETMTTKGDTTISHFNFVPSLEDDGKYITCIAEHPSFYGSTMESYAWRLDIFHVPVVHLELGKRFNDTSIVEGSDVYFECRVKSKPWIYKISWKHNGKMLYNNASEGIIISNYSLVLQDVKRHTGGLYTCVGTNSEGDGESNSIHLVVHFAPVCQSNSTIAYRIPLHKTIRIVCEVEANPANIDFIWKLNSNEISTHLISVHQTTSILSYTPTSEQDYGILQCTGTNSVGYQQRPCKFQISFPDKPDPLSNCSLLNQTHQSLLVKCAQRLDRGLNQTFVAEVYDIQTQTLLKNISSKAPIFLLNRINQSSEIEISLYAINACGKSNPVKLKALLPKTYEEIPAAADVLLPPENCSLTSHTRYHLRIKCQISEIQRSKSLKYLLQVYDANSHTLVGTSTSHSPEAITITALPRDYQDLLLFIRTINETTVSSDATILYAVLPAKTSSLIHNVSAPVKFYITPTSAITISVALAVILIGIAAITICHFCKKRGNYEKECDDGGLSSTTPHCAAIINKERHLNVTANDAENINPDIIPLKSNKDKREDESSGDVLHPTSTNTYISLQDAEEPSLRMPRNIQTPYLEKAPIPYYMNTQPQGYQPILPPYLNRPMNVPMYRYEVPVLSSPQHMDSESHKVTQPLLNRRVPTINLMPHQTRVTQL